MDRIDLERYIEKNGIDAEIISTGTSVHTAKAAAEKLDVDTSQIIKSLVFMADDEPVMLVVPGDREVDMKKAKEVLDVDDIRLADKKEVEEATGYSVGEVPPVGVDIDTVIHTDVMDNDKVYGGGGSDEYLIQIIPEDIVDYADAVVKSFD